MNPAPDREARFREAYNALEPYVERRFGIPVVLTKIAPPFTGDLDGAGIYVDFELDAENGLFLLAHLFGHTVQWNVSERSRELGTLPVTGASDELLAELAAYEEEAARYSVQLFHDAGVLDLDQWLSDFAACDIAYLLHFYRTGEKREFRSFWRERTSLLAPLEIPEFRPVRWVTRGGGVVV